MPVPGTVSSLIPYIFTPQDGPWNIALNAVFSTISLGVGSSASDIASINSEIATLQSDVTSLNSSVTSIDSSITTINGQITSIESAISVIGNYVSATLASGSAISLSNGSAATVTSIILAAGDWDVAAIAIFNGNASTVSNFLGSISATAATLDGTDTRQCNLIYTSGSPLGSGAVHLLIGPSRFTPSVATTIYLVGEAFFTGGTCNAFGTIRARRFD